MFENIFKQAKEVSVYDYLSGKGFYLFLQSQNYRSNCCPYCGPADNRDSNKLLITPNLQGWYCFACGERGDVIKAVQLLEGIDSPKRAAEFLLGEVKFKSSPPSLPKRIGKEEEKEIYKKRLDIIKLILQQSNPNRLDCWQYLIKKRGITTPVIKMAMQKGMVYFMSPIIKVDINLLHSASAEYNGQFMFWNRPLIFPFREKGKIIGAEFRTLNSAITKKAKSLGKKNFWWWQGNKNNNILLVEGMIDLLSALDMGWEGSIIGLPSTGSMKRLIEKISNSSFFKGKNFYLALDGDQSGAKAKEMFLEKFPATTLSIPEGMDLNDLLKAGCKEWRELLKKEEKREVQVC